MSHTLLVGHSMMTAHNMARDLIDSKGENIWKTDKRAELPFILTDEGNHYTFLAHFEVAEKHRELRGQKFTEVYFMGDFTGSLIETLKEQLVGNTPAAKFFLVEPDAIGFIFK